MTYLRYFLVFFLAFFVATTNNTSLKAQETETSSDFSIEEIIVTAQKVEESAQSVPIALTAITEELTRSTIRNLSDLTGFAPNVLIGANSSRGGSSGGDINIRGISPTRSDDNSFDAPIAVMVDGIYLGSLAGQILENFDIERVEILRGPQGTLFGKNTVGGVVNVIRSRPTGELGARLKATVGEDGQEELRLVVNTPIIEGKLAAKFFATNIEYDGFMTNITTGRKNPYKDYSAYGATFLITPTDKFEAVLTVEQFDDQSMLDAFHTNYNYAVGIADAPKDPREKDLRLGSLTCTLYGASHNACRTSTDIPSHMEIDSEHPAHLEIDAITLNASYEINENNKLSAIIGYREMDEYRLYDFDGSAAPFITIDRKNQFEQTSAEFRWEAQWENSSLIAGVYLWNSEFTQDWSTGGTFWSVLFGAVAYNPALWAACLGTNGLDGAFAPIACDSGLTSVAPGDHVTQVLYETQETESTAFFAQYEHDLTDQWTVTIGARWTEEEKDFVAGQSYLSNYARQWERNFPGYATLSNKWTEVSPKVGVSYQIDDTSMVYFSYSEGFHSGGFFGVNQNIRDFERDQYDPEYANNIEIGYKSMHLNNRLRLNLAAFHNEFEDKQESFVKLDDDTKTVASVFDNAAEVLYEGFEVEILFAATEDLRLFLNYGYLDASYEEFETDLQLGHETQVQDATHLTPRQAPEWTLGIGFIYNRQVGKGELEIHTKLAQVADRETDLLNLSTGRIKGSDAEDLSASIGYYQDNWGISLFGKNLTDARYEFPVVLGGSPIAAPLFSVGTVNHPRSIGMEFSYDF